MEKLRFRMIAGEQPIEELRALMAETAEGFDPALTEDVSDVWNAVLHRKLLPTIETAKAVVVTAINGDSSYPILTNDALIYDALSHPERVELVQFMREHTGDIESPVTVRVFCDFENDLLGNGPQL